MRCRKLSTFEKYNVGLLATSDDVHCVFLAVAVSLGW